MGVEPTGDRIACRPPVLKITQSVLSGYEDYLFYSTLQRLLRFSVLTHSERTSMVMSMDLSRFYHGRRDCIIAGGHCAPSDVLGEAVAKGSLSLGLSNA